MFTRRQVLRGASATAVVAAGAAVLPGLAGTALADPAAPAVQAGQQSPINILPGSVRPGGTPLAISYPTNVDLEVRYISRDAPAGCGIPHAEETIEASEFSAPATVTVGSDVYELLQTHFHVRSEHTLSGVRFAMEQHFVHTRVGDGARLVLGAWLVQGPGGTPQDKTLATLPAECGDAVHVTGVNLRGMLPGALSTFAYDGSLTTAPYDEGVRWHVLVAPKPIGIATINRFRGAFPGGNARGVQPLNGRRIALTPGHLV